MSRSLVEAQHKAIDRLYEEDETMLIAPKGFGKCVVGFTAIQELIKDGIVKRVLVLSTAQVCTDTWAQESKEWDHLEIPYVCLTKHDAQTRKSLMAQKTPIVICNFENMAWLLKTYEDHDFDGLLVDEITKLKTVGGEGYKILRKHLKKFSWRVGMTADPTAQESTDLYGQLLIIDYGRSLGRNQDRFRRKYFMQDDYYGRDWVPQPGGLERLSRDTAKVIYKVDPTEYEESLPDLVDHFIPVEMGGQTRAIYEELAKHRIADVGRHTVETPNAALLSAKLRQLANGFIYINEEETSVDEEGYERVEKSRRTIVARSSKFDALDDLLNSIKDPVLIVYEYEYQLSYLKARYGFYNYHSGLSESEKSIMIDQWNKGFLRALVGHPKSIGHGLNLQYGPCKDLICLSPFWSHDQWDQVGGRLRRRGQKADQINRWVIYTKDTIEDQVIMPSLVNRKNMTEEFNNYLERF